MLTYLLPMLKEENKRSIFKPGLLCRALSLSWGVLMGPTWWLRKGKRLWLVSPDRQKALNSMRVRFQPQYCPTTSHTLFPFVLTFVVSTICVNLENWKLW